jgi:uncharacterized membrane protein YbhN (UPF0104 family)
MSFEGALSWVAVLAGGLSPILVSFVALVIGRSRRRKLYYRTLTSRGIARIAAPITIGFFVVSCTVPSMAVQRFPTSVAEARGPAPAAASRGYPLGCV